MLYFVLVLLITVNFRYWFTFLPISAGDFIYPFDEQLYSLLNVPLTWESFRNVGFGGTSFIHQGLYLYNLPLGLLSHVVSYGVAERIVYFFPILLLGVFSPVFLAKTLRIFPAKFFSIASIIYFLNTYILTVIAGGQITVVFGYVMIPWLFACFIKILQEFQIRTLLVFSLLLALLIAFDYRFAYIFFVLAGLYVLYLFILSTSFTTVISLVKRLIVVFSVGFGIVFLLHFFWILPFITHFSNPVSSATGAYTSAGAVQYFSFAQLEQSLSLLHPLWPENIFGKVSFMKVEYIPLAILAYSSLFFISRKKQTRRYMYLIFFVLIGLIGSFLAKGANEPFGAGYLWLFQTLPGFIMFRDPTKWYTLVAISYSILISFTISQVFDWIKSQPKFQISNFKFQIKPKNKIVNYQNIFLLLTTCYLILLIYPAITGKIGGTLRSVNVPQEYVDIKNFLVKDKTFSRVMWVPSTPRFAFYSDAHPPISGKDFFANYKKYGVVAELKKNGVDQRLRDGSVRYIVVPYDSQKEIYIEDREYDENEWKKTVEALKKIPWLTQTHTFGKTVVFELRDPKPHFWSENKEMEITPKIIDATNYELSIKNAKKGDRVIFVESYDSGWVMKDDTKEVTSQVYKGIYNSFILPRGGNLTVRVSFKPQELISLGLAVSAATLVFLLSGLVFLSRKKRSKDL